MQNIQVDDLGNTGRTWSYPFFFFVLGWGFDENSVYLVDCSLFIPLFFATWWFLLANLLL